MEKRVDYTKPGAWKRIIYFILIFIPLFFMLRYTAGLYGISRGYGLLMKMELSDDQAEIGLMVLNTVIDYWNSSFERVAELKIPAEPGELAVLKANSPEVIEAYHISGGKATQIYSGQDEQALHDFIAERVMSTYDSLNRDDSWYNVLKNSGYKTKRADLEFAGTRLHFVYLMMPDEVRLAVTESGKFLENIELVLSGMEKNDPPLFEQVFGRYPSKFVEMTIVDEGGKIYYSAGRKHGKGWDEVKTYHLPGWNLNIKCYPDEATLRALDWANYQVWKQLLDFALAMILLILLGHFSPKLHGFSLRKADNTENSGTITE